MKKHIVFAAVFAVFTVLCFGMGMLFPDNDRSFRRIWYVVMIAAWCVMAAKLLSLSFKLSKIKKGGRGYKNRRKTKHRSNDWRDNGK